MNKHTSPHNHHFNTHSCTVLPFASEQVWHAMVVSRGSLRFKPTDHHLSLNPRLGLVVLAVWLEAIK